MKRPKHETKGINAAAWFAGQSFNGGLPQRAAVAKAAETLDQILKTADIHAALKSALDAMKGGRS